MRHWIVITTGGEEERWIAEARDPEPGTNCRAAARLPRAMEAWEDWDWERGEIVVNAARRREQAEREADTGLAERGALHHRKAVEALLFRVTGNPESAPMLAAEAEATGVMLDALVAMVIDRDGETIATETKRRKAKHEARNM